MEDFTFELIWAVDEDDGLGKDGMIPWHVPRDLANFRNVTTRGETKNVCIMGRKTWESIPEMFKPLRNRVNIVISTNPRNIEDFDKYYTDVAFVLSFEDALALAEIIQWEEECDVFVIGGASIYKQAIDMEECVGIHETIVDGIYECDVFAPTYSFSEDYDLVEDRQIADDATYFYWKKKGTYSEDIVDEKD